MHRRIVLLAAMAAALVSLAGCGTPSRAAPPTSYTGVRVQIKELDEAFNLTATILGQHTPLEQTNRQAQIIETQWQESRNALNMVTRKKLVARVTQTGQYEAEITVNAIQQQANKTTGYDTASATNTQWTPGVDDSDLARQVLTELRDAIDRRIRERKQG